MMPPPAFCCHRFRRSAVCLLSGLLLTGPSPGAAQSGTGFPLRPDGVEQQILAPGTRGKAAQVVVEGTVRCGLDDGLFDALYRTDAAGRFTLRHDYLQLLPGEWEVVIADPQAHRYVFQPAPGFDPTGHWVAVRWNIEAMYDYYVNLGAVGPMSELRNALHSNLRVRLVSLPSAAPVSRLSLVGGAVAVGLLALLGLIRWRQLRMAQKALLEADLQATLNRIREKYEALLALIDSQPMDLAALRERFARLYEGAAEIARHVQTFRHTERQVDRLELERELQRLERERERATEAELREELDAALAEKEKVRRLLDETRRNRERYAARLTKVEAIIESTRLAIPNLAVAQEDAIAEDRLIAAVDEELAVLGEAVAELRAI